MFVIEKDNKLILPDELEKADFLIIQTSSNDNAPHSINVEQCLEDIVQRTKATILFLDFVNVAKHQLFFDSYQSNYISLNISNCTAHFYHPDTYCMNSGFLCLKEMVLQGLRKFEQKFNNSNNLKYQTQKSKFKYEEIKHIKYQFLINKQYPPNEEQLLHWKACRTHYRTICYPQGFSFQGNESEEIEFHFDISHCLFTLI